jgi:carbonic anhydrase
VVQQDLAAGRDRVATLKPQAGASKAQVERFSGTIGEDNNRPVQPINARAVLRCTHLAAPAQRLPF